MGDPAADTETVIVSETPTQFASEPDMTVIVTWTSPATAPGAAVMTIVSGEFQVVPSKVRVESLNSTCPASITASSRVTAESGWASKITVIESEAPPSSTTVVSAV